MLLGDAAVKTGGRKIRGAVREWQLVPAARTNEQELEAIAKESLKAEVANAAPAVTGA